MRTFLLSNSLSSSSSPSPSLPSPRLRDSKNSISTPFSLSVEYFPCPPTPKVRVVPTKHGLKAIESSDALLNGNGGVVVGSDEEDDAELCPVDCVKEFNTEEEFQKILEKAKETHALVVVDFYRTSCGSCKYIEQGFMKLCKGSGDEEADVVFLKHNVIDEYDEQSEVAERLRIKAVPLFHFYRDGVLLEAFPTRDKERIIAAIQKYTSSS